MPVWVLSFLHPYQQRSTSQVDTDELALLPVNTWIIPLHQSAAHMAWLVPVTSLSLQNSIQNKKADK